jgi:hypothetical protein
MSNLHYFDYLYFNESITKIAGESTKLFSRYVVHKHHFLQINDRHYVLASIKKNSQNQVSFYTEMGLPWNFITLLRGKLVCSFLT